MTPPPTDPTSVNLHVFRRGAWVPWDGYANPGPGAIEPRYFPGSQVTVSAPAVQGISIPAGNLTNFLANNVTPGATYTVYLTGTGSASFSTETDEGALLTAPGEFNFTQFEGTQQRITVSTDEPGQGLSGASIRVDFAPPPQ